jgi:hypothetical protein
VATQAVVTKVTIQLAVQIHVIMGAVKLVGLLTAKAPASLTMCLKHGLAMATATMVHIFQLIMVVMNAPQV